MKFYWNKQCFIVLITLINFCFSINNKKQIEDLATLNVTYNAYKNNDIPYLSENHNINLEYNLDSINNNYDEVNENQYYFNTDKINKLKSIQNKLEINKKESSHVIVERKTKKKEDDYNEIQKNYKINSIKSSINLFSNLASGFIKEKIYFELNRGLHDKVIRKISLGGTSDTIDNLRVSSYDVVLKNAILVKNCFENKSIYDHSYICVIVNFQEQLIIENTLIEIEFDYIGENLIRKREKPFNNKELENVLVFIYDNNKSLDYIKNMIMSITLEFELEKNSLLAYPEKYSLIKNNKTETFDFSDLTTIIWNNVEIKPNEYKNFVLNIPLLNSNCKEINQIHLDLTTYSVIQFIIVISLVIASLIVFFIFSFNRKFKNDNDNEDLEDSRNQTFNTTTTNSSYAGESISKITYYTNRRDENF